MWENTVANENIHEYKIQLFMNTPAYLGQSIPEISKIVMYGFWYDYVKSKYWEKAKLSYMDTDSFIVYVKTEGIYVKVAKDVETRILYFKSWIR